MIRTGLLDRLRLRARSREHLLRRAEGAEAQADALVLRTETAEAQLARIDDVLREYDHRVTLDVADDVGGAIAIEHGRALLAARALERADDGVVDALILCGTDLDGAECGLPDGHVQPCAPSVRALARRVLVARGVVDETVHAAAAAQVLDEAGLLIPVGYRPEHDVGGVVRRLEAERITAVERRAVAGLVAVPGSPSRPGAAR